MPRPTWHEYFLIIAKLAALRSTCINRQVGCVIVKDRQVLATGYNGAPSGLPHCTDQGYCYPDLSDCGQSNTIPSRAVHAEANAIAQAAKYGIATNGATAYVTLEPCLTCLKLLVSAGITDIYYGETFSKSQVPLKQELIEAGAIAFHPTGIGEKAIAIEQVMVAIHLEQ